MRQVTKRISLLILQESEQRTLELVGGTIEDVDVSGLEDIVELNEDEQSQSEGIKFRLNATTWM